MTEKTFIEVPIWRKYALTIEEAAAYFRIGENKLRQMVNENPEAAPFLHVGNRTLIKRVLFEETLNALQAV